MKILIINSVPLNGGDEALLQATVLGLEKVFSDAQTTVLCRDHHTCLALMPEYSFFPDYELTVFDFDDSFSGRLKKYLKRRLHKLGLGDWLERWGILQTASQKRVLALIKGADLVISSPGGYLHDYYGYTARLKVFELIQSFGIPLVILAQSIGVLRMCIKPAKNSCFAIHEI